MQSQFLKSIHTSITDPVSSIYGLQDVQLQYMISSLQSLLGMEYALYVKTQNFHWNVTGMSFGSLHKLFEKQYKDLFEFVDRIAEQIRKYGKAAPGSMAEFLKLKGDLISEVEGSLISPQLMIADLALGHDTIAAFINGIYTEANSIKDQFGSGDVIDLATQNLLGDILDFHMKALWMLRAHLE